MTEQSAEQLTEHLSRTDPQLYAIVEEVRSVVVAVTAAAEQRRPIKLREISDVERLHVREFVSQAYAEISAQ